DEPLRLDPFLAQWILGDSGALADDPRVRRVLRLVPWEGATFLAGERARAARLLANLGEVGDTRWLVLAGDDPNGWRALVELGAEAEHVEPIRVETAHLATMAVADVEECA